MFADAIEAAGRFTRPIHFLTRSWDNPAITPGSATLFFVNEHGTAVTCRHVAELLVNADNINRNYQQFRNESVRIPQGNGYEVSFQALRTRYNYQSGSIFQVKSTFLDCVDTISGFITHLHPVYDLAIIQLQGFRQIRYDQVARFPGQSKAIRQGDMLCRLGFPFPEFTNFRYVQSNDDMEWTSAGIIASPRFPIEGMVTRFIGDTRGIHGIELSTPGLRGQSGGPLFDANGTVFGMQSSTKHLHLGFDMLNQQVLINNLPSQVSSHPFLHLGQCVHAAVIMSFLDKHRVQYYRN